jgi:ABC-type amino acid transport system permease subunit
LITRARIAQGATLVVAAVALWWMSHNVALALDDRGLSLGFDFLRQPAGFDIG